MKPSIEALEVAADDVVSRPATKCHTTAFGQPQVAEPFPPNG
jgi:hypothetical protein